MWVEVQQTEDHGHDPTTHDGFEESIAVEARPKRKAQQSSCVQEVRITLNGRFVSVKVTTLGTEERQTLISKFTVYIVQVLECIVSDIIVIDRSGTSQDLRAVS